MLYFLKVSKLRVRVGCIPAGSLFVALMFVRLTPIAAEKFASVKGVKLEKN